MRLLCLCTDQSSVVSVLGSKAGLVMPLLFAAGLLLLSGCEDLPPLAHAELAPLDIELPSREGARQTKISKPIPFTFFDQIDSDKVKSDIESFLAIDSGVPDRPDEMEQDVYQELMRFYGTGQLSEPVFSLPIKDSFKAFDISSDGKWLLCAASNLDIWDVASGQKKHSFALPAPAEQAFFCGQGEQVVLVGRRAITKHAFAGQIVAKWNAPAEIVRAAISEDSSVVAAYTNEQELLVLGEELEDKGKLAIELANADFSIHPEGEYLIGSSAEGPFRWQLSGLYQAKSQLQTGRFEADSSFCIPAKKFDVWIGPTWASAFEGSELVTYDESEAQTPAFMFVDLVAAEACSFNQQEYWQLAIGSTDNQGSGPRHFLVDCSFQSADFSIMQDLAYEPLGLAASLNGTVVAIRSAGQLQVYQRTAWPDSQGAWTAEGLAKLLINDDGFREEQTNLALQFIRDQQGVLRNAYTPGYMHYRTSHFLGKQWAALEAAGSGNRQTLTQLDKWREAGSDNALVVSSTRHQHFAFSVSQSDPQSWETRASRWAQALSEIQSCLKQYSSPPASAYPVLVECCNETGQSYDDAAGHLEEYVTNFPWEYIAHVGAGYWMLEENWGQEFKALDGESYATQLAALYPPEFSEVLYTRMAASIELRTDYKGVSTQCFDYARLAAGARRLLELGMMDSKYLMAIIYLRRYETNTGATSIRPETDPIRMEILDYLARRCVSVPTQSYYFVSPDELVAAKQRAKNSPK